MIITNPLIIIISVMNYLIIITISVKNNLIIAVSVKNSIIMIININNNNNKYNCDGLNVFAGAFLDQTAGII